MHCLRKPPAPPLHRCAGAPQGRQAGSWRGAGPYGYLAVCEFLIAATSMVIFGVSHFAIQAVVILSNVVVGLTLHCSVLSLSQAINADPPC